MGETLIALAIIGVFMLTVGMMRKTKGLFTKQKKKPIRKSPASDIHAEDDELAHRGR